MLKRTIEVIGVITLVVLFLAVSVYTYEAYRFGAVLEQCVEQTEIPFETCVYINK